MNAAKTTKTGQARGPLEMHHHRKPAPAATPIKPATGRSLGKPATTTLADPFDLCAGAEPADPFGM